MNEASEMKRLRHKVALVTGAAGEHGIGRAIAVRLAQEGADVVVSDLHSGERDAWRGLAAVAEEIAAIGCRAVPVCADITSSEQVDSLVAQAVAAFGRVDILVHNAAAPAGADRVPVVDLDEAVFDSVQRVNVKGTFLVNRAVARQLVAQGNGGAMINLASTAGLMGIANFGAYCTSKFAVIGLSECLAHELGPHGIRVNVLCPGLIETERLDQIVHSVKPPDVPFDTFRAQWVERYKQVPLRRIGQPNDVASVAAFLASEDAGFITGQAISVSGGRVMVH